MSFAKFLIATWMARPENYDGVPKGLPIRAVEGRYYSTLTGSDPPEFSKAKGKR